MYDVTYMYFKYYKPESRYTGISGASNVYKPSTKKHKQQTLGSVPSDYGGQREMYNFLLRNTVHLSVIRVMCMYNILSVRWYIMIYYTWVISVVLACEGVCAGVFDLQMDWVERECAKLQQNTPTQYLLLKYSSYYVISHSRFPFIPFSITFIKKCTTTNIHIVLTRHLLPYTSYLATSTYT